MIGKNIDDKFSTKKEIAPVFKGTDDCKEFMVPDGVIAFGLGEGGGIVSYGVAESDGIALVEDGTCHVLRGVYFHFKRFMVVGLVEDWVSGREGDQVVESGGGGWCPQERYPFLKEVQEGSGNFGETGNEGTVIA